jgi:hypothetical protein
MLGAPDGNRSPHIQSLTKIEDIHVAPQRPKPGLVNHKSGRTRIKNSHLPMGTTDRFTKNVLPIALDTVGALAPWDYPSDQQMVDMWNLIFGSPYDHPLVYGDIQGDVFVAVKGLVRICLGLHWVVIHALLRSSEESPRGCTSLQSLPKERLLPSLIVTASPASRKRLTLSSSFLVMPMTCQASTGPSSGSLYMKTRVKRILGLRCSGP